MTHARSSTSSTRSAAAKSGAVLDIVRERVSATETHASERRAIEQLLRSRADASRLANADATGSPGAV